MAKAIKRENKAKSTVYNPLTFKIFLALNILTLLLYLYSTYFTTICGEGACSLSTFSSDFWVGGVMYLFPLLILRWQQRGHIQYGYLIFISVLAEIGIYFYKSPVIFGNFLSSLLSLRIEIFLLQPLLGIVTFGTHLYMIGKLLQLNSSTLYTNKVNVKKVSFYSFPIVLLIYLLHFIIFLISSYIVLVSGGLGGGGSKVQWIPIFLLFTIIFILPLVVMHFQQKRNVRFGYVLLIPLVIQLIPRIFYLFIPELSLPLFVVHLCMIGRLIFYEVKKK